MTADLTRPTIRRNHRASFVISGGIVFAALVYGFAASPAFAAFLLYLLVTTIMLSVAAWLVKINATVFKLLGLGVGILAIVILCSGIGDALGLLRAG